VIETWKPIMGWRHHEISNLGHCRTKDRIVQRGNGAPQTVPGQLLKATTDSHGYPSVCLREPGRQKQVRVHVLVLQNFVGPCPKGQEGLHKNDVKTDPRLDNLYWGTRVQNHADAARNGRAWWVKKRVRDAAGE
jgi:hypothetical protein